MSGIRSSLLIELMNHRRAKRRYIVVDLDARRSSVRVVEAVECCWINCCSAIVDLIARINSLLIVGPLKCGGVHCHCIVIDLILEILGIWVTTKPHSQAEIT